MREEPVSSTARGVIRGLHVIQVNEMYNCAAPSKHRFEDAGRNRCMKKSVIRVILKRVVNCE